EGGARSLPGLHRVRPGRSALRSEERSREPALDDGGRAVRAEDQAGDIARGAESQSEAEGHGAGAPRQPAVGDARRRVGVGGDPRDGIAYRSTSAYTGA